MAVLCQTLISIMEELAPLTLAEKWDNPGLLVGDREAEVTGVLVALDLDLSVVREALQQNANFVVVHHPPIFHPLKQLTASEPVGKLLLQAAGQGLNVYAAHTNLDKVKGGVNDQLARVLQLNQIDILTAREKETYYKLVVFVPETHEAQVRMALGDAGAGFIGNYSHCSFRTAGTGTFLPRSGADPFLGQVGRLEEAAEYRLETIVPGSLLGSVISAMKKAHPYEEVAYDLYPLVLEGDWAGGLGRVGLLPEPLTVDGLIALVKERLAVPAVKVVPGNQKLIRRVAVCGGSGGNLVQTAVKKGAQALITGEVDYHQGQLAQSLGLTVIDAGHGPTERVVLPWLKEQLQQKLAKQEKELQVIASQVNTDPWYFY